MEFTRKYKVFILIMILASILRLVNLGYSDYQGDEIKAFFRPNDDQSEVDFLLNQRKGPIQFIITGFIGYFDNNFSNRFIARLPFALAGIFSIYFFYKLVLLNYG